MTKPSFRPVAFAFALISVLCLPAWAVDEDLGFGYVRRGDHIHFIKGATTGTGIEGTPLRG